MKKLIAILGSLSIVASSVTVVGFQYANLVKSSLEAKVRNYINVSSLLARGTILSQNSQPSANQKTDGKDFSLGYASRYLYSKPISTFFDQSQFQNQDQNVLSYLGQMFNLSSSANPTYTVKNNPNFEVASPSLYLQNDVETGKKGEDATLNVLTMVGAFAPVLLGNDFSASVSAPFLENLLGAGESLIKGLMTDGTFKNLQQMLFNLIKDNDKSKKVSLFAKLSESLSEQDLITQFGADQLINLSFNDVFQFRQIKFWQGLSEILYSGSRAEISDDDFVSWMKSIDNSEKKYAENAILTGEGAPTIQVAANKLLFDGITRMLPYIRTLLIYFQSFSETSLPMNEINGYNNLFDPDEVNGVFITKKLKGVQDSQNKYNGLYLNENNVLSDTQTPDVVQWVKKNGQDQYHQVLNIQDLIQFLEQLLAIDLTTDDQGYRMERILAILLEVPLDPDKPDEKSDADNPIYDLILEPLLTQLVKILIPGSGDLIGMAIPSIGSVLRAVLTHNHNLWDKVPASGLFATNFIGVLNLLIAFAPTIGDALGIKNFKAILEELILKIQKEQKLVERGLLPVEQQIYGQPFKTLFHGKLLPEILKIAMNHDNPIAEKVQNIFKDLATIFTTKLGDVLASFGLDLTTLPIFLYGIKELSLTEIINSFAEEFKTNLNKTLKENQEFLFNLDALNRVIVALDQLDQEEKVDLQFNLENGAQIPEPVKEVLGEADAEGRFKNVNLLNAILVTFAYNNQIKELITTQEKWSDSDQISKYGFLLGTRQINGESSFAFAPGSVFYALSQIYGHDNEVDPEVIQPKNKNTLKTTLTGFAKLVTWFNLFSAPLYLKEVFDPYFDSKHWKTELIKFRDLDQKEKTGIINYFLDYQNPDLDHQTHRYEVKLARDPTIGNGEEWTEMGTWKIISINLKK